MFTTILVPVDGSELAERALSNEVITPGKTTLEDVAWWLQEELLKRGLGSSFDMPSVYVTGKKGIEGLSNGRIIQGGDFLAIDWGVYGAPETFLVDKKGRVVFKHIAPMTMEVWQKEFLPRIAAAQREAS